MYKKRKVFVVIERRADYSRYKPILEKMREDKFFEIHLVVTGICLLEIHGKDVDYIKKDGFIINSEIDGSDIIYHNHIDLGIAIGAPQGLLVPVIREADLKSFSEIEQEIYNFGIEAKNGSITTDQMIGGTFTITNGGIYGSMMSTPILNPPQTAILGLHQIKDRAVVENGEIKIKPMMYVALTYDHRAVSGKEAVSFLVKIKGFIEDPERMLIGS